MATVIDFGADPTGSRDSTAAFQQAITSCGNVLMPAANYLISDTLQLPANSSLVCPAGKATITTAASNFPLCHLTGSNITIDGMIIKNAAKTGGADFLIDAASGDLEQIHLEDIESFGGYGFVADAGAGTNGYYLTFLKRCAARQLRGVGYSFTRSVGYLYVEDCMGEYVGSSGPCNETVFALDNSVLISAGRGAVGGSFWRGCSAAGGAGAIGSSPNQCGFYFRNTEEVWIAECDADTLDGYGYMFDTVDHIHMRGSEASLNNNNGVALLNCAWGEFGNVRILGNTPRQGAAAGVHGLHLIGGNSILTFTGVNVFDCEGDGIHIPQQGGPINLSGGMVSGCRGQGLFAAGTEGMLASGMTLVGNAGGNYSLGGGAQYLRSCMMNNGGVVDAGPGPVAG